VDKEKWNDIMRGTAYTLLALPISLNDTSIVLNDSSDFGDGGTVQIGSNIYAYTANNRSTGTLTITAATTTDVAGADVFEFPNMGEPLYYTIINGYFYHYPIMGTTQPNRNYVLDYYKKMVPVVNDSDETVLPDPTLVQYYLAWKFLLKINNGEDTNASVLMYQRFVASKKNLKDKETLGRTFRFKTHPKSDSIDLEKFYRIGNYLT
jgi:hypothetical protein